MSGTLAEMEARTGILGMPGKRRARYLARMGDDEIARRYQAAAMAGDDDLQALYLADMERRDQARTAEREHAIRSEAWRGTARGQEHTALTGEWEALAESEFLRAEAALAGNLLSREGDAQGRAAHPMLWTCTPAEFDRWASDDFKRWIEHRELSVTRKGAYLDGSYWTAHAGNPWDEPGWQAPEPTPTPRRRTVPGAGDGIPAAVQGSTEAQRRAARLAEREAWRAARTPRAGAVRFRTRPSEAGSVSTKPPCAGCTGPGPECKHPDRWTGRAGSALAVPQAGQVITPGRGAITSPGRAMPDAAEMLPQLLDEIGLLITDYVYLPSRSLAVAITAWAAHAAARDGDRRLIWRASPRLILTSEQNGTGKSTVLDILRILLQSRSGRMAKVTAPGLAMVLNKFQDTALLDEVNVTFGSGRDARDVQAVLLAGYSRGGTWVNGRASGTVMDVSGAAAMAGKDDLITRQRDALKDLLARSIIGRMVRPPVFLPQFDEDAEDRAAALSRALWAIMGSLGPQLAQASRDLARELAGSAITDGDGGRIAQIWRPLDAVARIAGGRWPEALQQARAELSAASGDLITAQDELTGLEEARAALGSAGRNFWDE
jgi:hypothetical protein